MYSMYIVLVKCLVIIILNYYTPFAKIIIIPVQRKPYTVLCKKVCTKFMNLHAQFMKEHLLSVIINEYKLILQYLKTRRGKYNTTYNHYL